MKVTKAKGLENHTVRSVSLRTTLTLRLHIPVHWDCCSPASLDSLASRRIVLPLQALRHLGDAQRTGWRRTANNPNEGGWLAEVAVLSEAGQNEPYGVVLRPFALVTFIWASNESDSPVRAKQTLKQ